MSKKMGVKGKTGEKTDTLRISKDLREIRRSQET